MPGPGVHIKVDYTQKTSERRRMSHYLRATNFKKIAGSPVVGHSIRRNRVLVTIVFLAIIATGMYFVIF